MGLNIHSRIFFLIVMLLVSVSGFCAIETHEFTNDTERARYQTLIDEMRCPKCQNQNLAGSDSAISMDLRREIYELIKEGKSDKEIVEFMVARYGEFILYKPRVTSLTYVLWGAPFVLFIGAIIVLLVVVRQRKQQLADERGGALTESESAALAAILKQDESTQSSK